MRKILLTLLAVVAAGVLLGCGNSSNNSIPVPQPPSGGNVGAGFGPTSLSGTYVFTAHGYTGNTAYAVVGSFVADGVGTITSGTRDTVNDQGSQTLNESITGTYSVNGDGRGQAVITGSTTGQVIYRFVLSSPCSGTPSAPTACAAGSLFQDGTDLNGNVHYDAVGTLALQLLAPAAPTASTYVVRLDGEDTTKNLYGAIGSLTYSGDANGSFSAILDENDGGVISSQPAATGNITLTATRGTQTLTGVNNSTTPQDFVVYYVSPTHLELLGTSGPNTAGFFLYGHQDQQSTVGAATFTGDQVFSLNGYDSTGNPIIETGRVTLDGAGNFVANSGIVDYNQGGTFYGGSTFTGGYTITPNGRWAANLVPAAGGVLTALNLVGWQISSQQSNVLVTTATDPTVANYLLVETGTMLAQTTGLTDASVTGNYAQALSGYSYTDGSLESTGNYNADGSGHLNGTIDYQIDSSGFSPDNSQTGTYSVNGTTGRGAGLVADTLGAYFYTVNPSTVFIISSDNNFALLGTLVSQ